MYYINNKIVEILNSKEYGLNPRTIIGKTDDLIALIKDRKSRIIMKDGRQILDQIDSVKMNSKVEKIALATNAPICGKTIKLLAESKVEVFQLIK